MQLTALSLSSFYFSSAPRCGSAAGANIISVISCKSAFALSVDHSAATLADKHVFHGKLSRSVILNTLFNPCSYSLNIVTIESIHLKCILLPSSRMFHASLTGVK